MTLITDDFLNVGKMLSKTFSINQSKLTIREGNIVSSKSEVLVSSDDTHLTMSGGVSGSILLAGGIQIHLDASKHIPAELGDVIITSAGNLDAKYIFHTMTLLHPATIYESKLSPSEISQKTRSSTEIIFNSVKKCLDLMVIHKLTTISFPVIGTGTAGFNYKETIIYMVSMVFYLLRHYLNPLHVTIFLFNFEERTGKSVTQFLEELNVRLTDSNLKAFVESIELANIPSDSVFSKARSLILKSKFNLLEGDMDSALTNLQSALALAEEQELGNLRDEINLEITKLTKDFDDWEKKIRMKLSFNEVIAELNFQKYLEEAQVVYLAKKSRKRRGK